MQKNIIGFKKLQFKIIKKRKEKKRWKKKERKKKKKKQENFTELQKPNVQVEVYNNNRKCD